MYVCFFVYFIFLKKDLKKAFDPLSDFFCTDDNQSYFSKNIVYVKEKYYLRRP